MGTYSIKDLELYSGIKAHTIRMWEKRYNLLDPDRTNTNIRTYTDEQFKRLLNIATLKASGMKISVISKLSQEELNALVLESQFNLNQSNGFKVQINALIRCMFSYDEDGVNQIFSSSVLQLGLQDTFIKIIYPMLSRIGYMWTADKVHPGHEHFMSHILRQKLMSAIENLVVEKWSNKRVLLFLPSNQYHDLGLLLANYVLKKSGHQTLYMGQSTPISSVSATTEQWDPDFLVFTSSVLSNSQLPNWIKELQKENIDRRLIWAGRNAMPYADVVPSNVTCLCCFDELSDLVNSSLYN